MLRLKVQKSGDGLHPSEVVVEVRTADGSRENLLIDRRTLHDGTIGVGYPIGSEQGRVLVELPRETMSGSWRVWVPADTVVEEAAA